MNWGIEKDEQGFHITDDSNFSDIAVVYDEKYAKLLSAAPDLLSALQLAYKALVVVSANYDVDMHIEKAESAIKKALGE